MAQHNFANPPHTHSHTERYLFSCFSFHFFRSILIKFHMINDSRNRRKRKRKIETEIESWKKYCFFLFYTNLAWKIPKSLFLLISFSCVSWFFFPFSSLAHRNGGWILFFYSEEINVKLFTLKCMKPLDLYFIGRCRGKE